ncbi:hypothetical protein BSK47_09760 [Paenibacillus odorifer]|uniref:Uncharacterized protein n=1 Tax=Paenibacillus odorifer TaxID=189426 RepID=A0AB36JH78_9BACL|nr:hypothetical protein BSK47_09760 [Paenibacillus odorifer]
MIVASLRLMGTGCSFDNWISWICAGYARMNTQEGKSGVKVKTGGETQKVGERKVKAGSLRCANAKTRTLRYAR